MKSKNFKGKDITKDVKKMIDKLEQIGRDNDYMLGVDREVLEKLQYIINDNLITY